MPGEPYAVEIRCESTTVDLAFGANKRYVLIVSSLGDAGQVYPVSLKAEPVAKVVSSPVRPVAPFRAEQVSADFTTGNRQRVESAGRTTPNLRAPMRDFYLHVKDGKLDDPTQYVQVSSRMVSEGKEVRVYLDRRQNLHELEPGVADEVVRSLEEEIIPRLQRTLGSTRDIDGDGKLAVLLTPWLGCLQGGKTSLNGFVRGADFRSGLEPPFSNRCDMLYLNSNVSAGPHLRTLLAHELTHAICFSQRLSSAHRDHALPDEEDWLNEAIAHLGENPDGRRWSNLHYRVSRYLDSPRDYPLVVSDYHRAGWWRNHGCRGATYLFLRWCVDQYGAGLLPRLIRSPWCGTRNLEQATGERFDNLYRRWTLAILKSASQQGTTGFCSHTSDCRADGGYVSLDLCSPLAEWGLGGPRTEVWNVDRGYRQIKLRGTATAFLELESTGAVGVRRIRLRAGSGANVQVSLLRRADDWPRAWIEAEWARPSPHDSKGRQGGQPNMSFRSIDVGRFRWSLVSCQKDKLRRVRSIEAVADGMCHTLCVRIRAVGSGGLRVETIACEQKSDEQGRSFCFTGERLSQAQTSQATYNKTDLTAGFRLPIATWRGPTTERETEVETPIKPEMSIKAVISDDRGRRATVRTTIRAPERSDSELQIAAISRKKGNGKRQK